MVLMKMLMEIALSRWEEHWWWRWRWFPPPGGKFPRQNSSARALDWFRQGSASWRRSFIREDGLWFFPHRKTPHSRRWPSEGHQGATRKGARPGGRARPPPSSAGCGPPGELLALNIYYIFRNWLPWSFRTFGAVQNRSLIFAPFPAQNPSCRHSPSLCKRCKIRENRHKYCDIMRSNIP